MPLFDTLHAFGGTQQDIVSPTNTKIGSQMESSLFYKSRSTEMAIYCALPLTKLNKMERKNTNTRQTIHGKIYFYQLFG